MLYFIDLGNIMINLENIFVEIGQKTVLKDINLKINKNETILVIGPNGHGKSTLFKTIFKHYSTKISSGKYYINDKIANDFSTDQIANEKLYLAMQNPVEIPGLRVLDLLRNEINPNEKISVFELYKKVNKQLVSFNLDNEIIERNINEDFSGGEKKKMEILQLEYLNPDFIFLDEIDSGLDVDSLNIIAQKLIEKQKEKKSIIFISHNIELVKKLNPSRVILIGNGEIIKESDISLAYEIYEKGYKKIFDELNISLNKIEDHSTDLKDTLDGYYCHGK